MEYKLKTGDALKCSACGNKTFDEKQMSMGGEPCWCYICERCNNMMSFMKPNEKK